MPTSVRPLLLPCLLSLLLLGACYDLRPGSSSSVGSAEDGDGSAEGDDAGADDDDAGADDDDAGADDDDAVQDADGDGYLVPEDCDDSDPAVYPGALEECNGIDDNCDGVIDEPDGQNWYIDGDGDGYGTDASVQWACEPPPGGVSDGGDCDDSDASIYPGSTQQLDGVDSDCDGLLDWDVTIYTAVDDAGELCIDGEDNVLGETGGWVTGVARQIWLTSGVHTIGMQGWDTGQIITAGIAHIELSDGSLWVSDGTWRYDPNPEAGEDSRSGWCEPTFDDSAWDLVLDIGPIGDPANPWGAAPSLFPHDSPARWIWDHFPVNLNTQYLRKEFTLP